VRGEIAASQAGGDPQVVEIRQLRVVQYGHHLQPCRFVNSGVDRDASAMSSSIPERR
jgi:hypothetical protein